LHLETIEASFPAASSFSTHGLRSAIVVYSQPLPRSFNGNLDEDVDGDVSLAVLCGLVWLGLVLGAFDAERCPN